MVRIRLKRLGRKKRPFYRVVVTDQRNRRDGAPICELGYYDPIRKQLKLNKTEALAWILKGAQPSETVNRLIQLAPEGFELFDIPKLVKVVVKEEPAVEAKVAPVAAKAVEAEKLSHAEEVKELDAAISELPETAVAVAD